jgi:hypothetical protein
VVKTKVKKEIIKNLDTEEKELEESIIGRTIQLNSVMIQRMRTRLRMPWSFISLRRLGMMTEWIMRILARRIV